MVVRPATRRDLGDVVTMGRAFHAASPYAEVFAFNPDQCRKTADWILGQGVIYVAERPPEGCAGFDAHPLASHDTLCRCGVGRQAHPLLGMIGMAVTPHLVSGTLTATEVFWWVDPKARGIGLRLLRAAEAWAKDQGAVLLHLIAPDARAAKLYERLGFRRMEQVYQRQIG